jgi:hypothetical protein
MAARPPDDAPGRIEGFICDCVAGAVGFAFFPGWLLSLAGVPLSILLLLCCGAGVIFSLYMHFADRES